MFPTFGTALISIRTHARINILLLWEQSKTSKSRKKASVSQQSSVLLKHPEKGREMRASTPNPKIRPAGRLGATNLIVNEECVHSSLYFDFLSEKLPGAGERKLTT